MQATKTILGFIAFVNHVTIIFDYETGMIKFESTIGQNEIKLHVNTNRQLSDRIWQFVSGAISFATILFVLIGFYRLSSAVIDVFQLEEPAKTQKIEAVLALPLYVNIVIVTSPLLVFLFVRFFGPSVYNQIMEAISNDFTTKRIMNSRSNKPETSQIEITASGIDYIITEGENFHYSWSDFENLSFVNDTYFAKLKRKKEHVIISVAKLKSDELQNQVHQFMSSNILLKETAKV